MVGTYLAHVLTTKTFYLWSTMFFNSVLIDTGPALSLMDLTQSNIEHLKTPIHIPQALDGKPGII